MIYFDNAATTFPKPEQVYIALDRANRELGFNAGRGSYNAAKYASKIIDETREGIASFVDAKKDEVIFTTSSTEALNFIIFGIDWHEGDNIYVSPFEHNSIMRPLEEVRKRFNVRINIIPFEKDTWEVSKEIEDMFTLNKPNYIFCSAKSNVTGYILPYKEIFELGKKYKSINILDASQSYGIDKNITKINTDFIVFAGHKSLYSSFGVAGFIKIYNQKLKPWIFGGTGSDSLNLNMPDDEPTMYEAGSKNIIAIYGLHESIKWIKETDIQKKEKELSEYLVNVLKNNSKIHMYLPKNLKRWSSILSININGYTSEQVGELLEAENEICVRTGYHCAPLIHDFIDSKMFYGTIRISLNYFNTIEEIDELANALRLL